MYISVVVCTYNRDKYIESCLDSLSKQTLDKRSYELLLIDNNSTDRTSEICRHFEKIKSKDLVYRYITESQQGLSFARNRGIKESKGDLIVFIDDDAIADEWYLLEINRFFDNNQDILAGGGKILPKWGIAPPKWVSPFLMPLFSTIDLGDKNSYFKANKFPIGANMFIRKEAFNLASYFRTDLGRTGTSMMGGEEKAIFERIRNLSKIVYLSKASVFHCIPNERTQPEFIKKQALGIGKSEWVRVNRKGFRLIAKRLIQELIKWSASILLFVFYLITFRQSKGIMIIKFRYWVTKGFITGN